MESNSLFSQKIQENSENINLTEIELRYIFIEINVT